MRHLLRAPTSTLALTLFVLASVTGAPRSAPAQPGPIDLAFDQAMAWRPFGPASAGRITALEGDRTRHGVFYAAAAGAGLWKTTDFGATWTAIFEAPPFGHVTSVAVAGSRPTVIYAATRRSEGGELHRSDDAGATWSPVSAPGMVEAVAVDGADPERVFITTRVDGRPGGELLGSTDGGRTFTRVAHSSESVTGTTVFVDGPLLLTAGSTVAGAAPDLLLSTDNGLTWQPARSGGRLFEGPSHLDITRAADGTVLVLVAGPGSASLLASRDAGQSWTTLRARFQPAVRAETSPALSVAADGRVLVAAGTLFESLDDGATFAPATWVPHAREASLVWAHPTMAAVLMVGGRTGATITVNGGQSWSRPEALSAAAIEHVRVDEGFPWRVCATLARDVTCTSAWTERASSTWEPLPQEITGPVVSDPLEPAIVFGGGLARYDRRTEQIIDVHPDVTTATNRQPSAMAFSTDGRTLYAGAGAVFRTINGGLAWEAISPDLTAVEERSTRATISALTVSAVDARTLWAGLDDGRVFVTRDGGTSWDEAARPSLSPLLPVRAIEPSHFDANSAYVVVNAEGDSTRPGQLLRTRDGGATWINLAANMGEAGHVHTVREDPFRRGLLFAGTDRSVLLSFDDGDRWQPLQLNLPAVPVHDLAIKDATLIAGTSGRGVWILEDLSPLRQITSDVAEANLFLFRPTQAWRVRASSGTVGHQQEGTTAAPPGATLFYLLGDRSIGHVTVEVIETTTGDVIRRFSSQTHDDEISRPTLLSIESGLHRIAWDMRYTPPVPDHAVPGTAALPGTYQVRLTVDGRSVRQAITIRMDPRVRTSMLDLTAQRDLGRALDAARAGVHSAIVNDSTTVADPADPTTGGGTQQQRLAELAERLARLARALQRADVRPTDGLQAAIETALAQTAALLAAGS